MNEDRPLIFGWMKDSSRVAREYAPDAIYARIWNEIFEPDIIRSHVVTLHLYVEYWLDKLLEKLQIPSANITFSKKTEKLNAQGVFEPTLHKNVVSINRLRNIYAHELDLTSATVKVERLINKLVLDPYFLTTDTNLFRAVCLQTMFLLEATYNNNCRPPKLPSFPAETARQNLLRDGKLHWQYCEIISRKQLREYLEEWLLRCPLCAQGSIRRERDSTPGFQDSIMGSCSTCGLTGDGVYLQLDSAKPEFRN